MANNVNQKLPHECTSIDEVRSEIDNIDSEIIRLLGVRSGYVREVVKYKDNTPAAIEANDRRLTVISSRRQWAQNHGVSPDVVEQIYNTLIGYYIDEEKRIAHL